MSCYCNKIWCFRTNMLEENIQTKDRLTEEKRKLYNEEVIICTLFWVNESKCDKMVTICVKICKMLVWKPQETIWIMSIRMRGTKILHRSQRNVLWCIKRNKLNEDKAKYATGSIKLWKSRWGKLGYWKKPVKVRTSTVCVSVQGAFSSCLFNVCTSLALQLSWLDLLSGFPWKIPTPSFITSQRLAQSNYSASAISIKNIKLHASHLLWSMWPLANNIFFTLL